MEIGHSNVPVRLAKIASFIYDIVATDINITTLIETGSVVLSQRT